jgi:hypothetical protein
MSPFWWTYTVITPFTLLGSRFSVRVHVRFEVLGSTFEVLGSTFEVLGSTFEVRSSGFAARTTADGG